MKTKIKSLGDEFTKFYGKEIPEVDSNHTCLAVISLDFSLKKEKKILSSLSLKLCKYIEKRQLGILMTICVISLLLMNLMKDKLG